MSRVLTTITVGSGPFGVAVSATGATAGDVYVINYADNAVSVVSPSNNQVLTTITGFTGPCGVAVY
jgi:YVTN family beta-propeller protein